ncbi:uncharacterized protein LOC125668407 [Ostrea edulis]|uniref:uncharacterized protein LOC125668407 n=1 Tax=Ostrea edulis TaxID=37623 RepID=UPI002095D7B8|nr:uncharacterized protein LOC125668407 [Ostrea edulis]
MKSNGVLGLFLISAVLQGTSAWLFQKKTAVCQPVGKPFYFGKTNIWCMSLFPRRVSRSVHRNPFGISHRWIWYDGHYLEFGTRPHASVVIRNTHPMVGDFCPTKMEKKPAGYSVLPVQCIIGCARNYERVFGKFSKMKNNCHMFTNRMAEILCYNTVCPHWCLA